MSTNPDDDHDTELDAWWPITNPRQKPTEHDATHLPWRVGRSLGRTIYAQVSNDASKNDIVLGMMDTRDLAEHIVAIHNQHLDGESLAVITDPSQSEIEMLTVANQHLQEQVSKERSLRKLAVESAWRQSTWAIMLLAASSLGVGIAVGALLP